MASLVDRYAAINAYWFLLVQTGNDLAEQLPTLTGDEKEKMWTDYYTIQGIAGRVQTVLTQIQDEVVAEIATAVSGFPLIDALDEASNGQVIISEPVALKLLDTAKWLAEGQHDTKR